MTTQKIDPKKATQNNYKVIAKLYKEDFDSDYSDLSILVDEVIKYLKENNLSGEILDMGCGTGILTRYLQRHGITNPITGVDFTHEFLQDYQKEFPNCMAVEE